MDSAGLEMEEKVHFKLWVKPGCSPRCTQIVPNGTWMAKWLDVIVLNTHARRGAQTKSLFLPGANLDGFGLLKKGGKRMFEIMGQAWVFRWMYPNSTKMALGWPSGRK